MLSHLQRDFNWPEAVAVKLYTHAGIKLVVRRLVAAYQQKLAKTMRNLSRDEKEMHLKLTQHQKSMTESVMVAESKVNQVQQVKRTQGPPDTRKSDLKYNEGAAQEQMGHLEKKFQPREDGMLHKHSNNQHQTADMLTDGAATCMTSGQIVMASAATENRTRLQQSMPMQQSAERPVQNISTSIPTLDKKSLELIQVFLVFLAIFGLQKGGHTTRSAF